MPIRNIFWIGGGRGFRGARRTRGDPASDEPLAPRCRSRNGPAHATTRAPDSAAILTRTPDLRAELAATVHFTSDQWMIQPTDTEILDAKIAILEANPNVRIRIIGHSDEQGAEILGY